MRPTSELYFETLSHALRSAQTTDRRGGAMALDEAMTAVMAVARGVHEAGNKVMFVGNGGSAGIASHMAIDFTKNGRMRALVFNDGAALTCLGNDLGYSQVFAKQIEMHGRDGDLLMAISSSGNSANILAAADAARNARCAVVTFSGFSPVNKLRRLGDFNFHVASREYGIVEVAHQALLHAMLDIDMGWRPDLVAVTPRAVA